MKIRRYCRVSDQLMFASLHILLFVDRIKLLILLYIHNSRGSYLKIDIKLGIFRLIKLLGI